MFEVAVIVSVCVSFGPAEMPARLIVCAAASSKIAAGSPIAAIVGASFTAVTATEKVRVIVGLSVWPSLTVTVIVALPD